MADFEQKKFARKLYNRQNVSKNGQSFLLKIDRNNFFICDMGTGNKLYEVNFFYLCCNKIKLMKQIPLFKKGFVIFLQALIAIRIRFPLFWRICFQLGSNLIK